MGKTTTKHMTGTGTVAFMAARMPFKSTHKEQAEYSVRVILDANDAAVAHLTEVSPAKVDTKTNAKLASEGKVSLSFVSGFQPTVWDVDGQQLAPENIPFFNGTKDNATAQIEYSVIDYGQAKIVRLSEIRLQSLEITPRDEDTKSLGDILNELGE